MLRTIAKHAWLVIVLTATPLWCLAQQQPAPVPQLPAADWRQMNSHPLPVAAVGKYGGDPAIEQEYGVKEVELRTYQLGNTQAQVVVEPAADVPSAYGLLTFYQTPTMAPVSGIELAVSDANETLMARGDKFIRFVRGQKPSISANDYHALLVFVGGEKPSASVMKALPAAMPQQGLVPGSEKFLLGLEAAKRVLPSFRTDLLGFDQGAEVQLAQYDTGNGTSTLMSVTYPTPQIARIRFGALTSFLGLNQEHGPNSDYGRRHGAYVFLVLNAGSAQVASSLMDRFQVTEGVSWDQRYQSERTFTMQLIHMFLAIFLLTAILISACLVAGILFFLSRRLAAKFFPDWQWGRTDEDQLIRLNLKS